MAATSTPAAHRDDTEIFADARLALDRSLEVPQTVRVHVEDGVATLTGTVPLPHHRVQAAAAVREIAGIERVVNHIVTTQQADTDTIGAS